MLQEGGRKGVERGGETTNNLQTAARRAGYREKLKYRKYENLRTTPVAPTPNHPHPPSISLSLSLSALVGSPALRNTGWLGGFREKRGRWVVYYLQQKYSVTSRGTIPAKSE